jgi:hypothetical protein
MQKVMADTLSTFEKKMSEITTKHLDCLEEIRLIQAGLITIGQLVSSSRTTMVTAHRGEKSREPKLRAPYCASTWRARCTIQPCCACTPQPKTSCETPSNRNKRSLPGNFESRGDIHATPPRNRPQSPRKQQEQAAVLVVRVYGHRLTCLQGTSMRP